jgi:hypothetical protein
MGKNKLTLYAEKAALSKAQPSIQYIYYYLSS